MLNNPAHQKQNLYRNLKSKVMVGLTIAATIVALIPLFLVLGYLLAKGATSVNWNFFTRMPTPVQRRPMPRSIRAARRRIRAPSTWLRY